MKTPKPIKSPEQKKADNYARVKAWREKNKDKVKAQKTRYREKHRQETRDFWNEWYKKNKSVAAIKKKSEEVLTPTTETTTPVSKPFGLWPARN